jgi:hypothetical protein
MSTAPAPAVGDLPGPVARGLEDFVQDARAALGETLHAIVLFGSAAENRMRATSDVNVVVVVSAFDQARVAALRPGIERAHAAIRLEILWLLTTEVAAAAEAFAVKFTDIARRHRTLHGPDPFAGLAVSRPATIARLRQVLLNQLLRLRATYAVDGPREERLALRIADAAAPLRVSAAEILELEGGPALAPREKRLLEPGAAGPVLLGLIDLADYLHRRVAQLS